MPTYDVTIQATVRKAIRVEADNRQAADEHAHQDFTILNDGEEYYKQETLEIDEVQPEPAVPVTQDMIRRVQALTTAGERRNAINTAKDIYSKVLYRQAKAAADAFCDAVVRKLFELAEHGLSVQRQFTAVNHEASGSVMCFLSHHVGGMHVCWAHVLADYPAYDVVTVRNYHEKAKSFQFKVTQSAEMAAQVYVETLLDGLEGKAR